MVASEGSLIGNSTTPVANTRDKDYYFQDGSIIVLAEDSLFKVHRTIFELNSPFFKSLMSLPQSGDQESQEGQSDESPVFCPDSAGDFRALCWVVYSSPTDVLAQNTWSTINVPKLIRLVAISHKYDFTTYCEWAWNVLDAYYTAQPLEFFHTCRRFSAFGRIFRLAAECGKKSLMERFGKTWLHKISTSTRPVPVLKEALDAVEGFDIFREFHAHCYYAYLRSSGVFSIQASKTNEIDLDQVGSHFGESLPDLNSERQMRLLTGFWSLSWLRVKLAQPPKLMENPSCAKHTRDCIPGWDSWWKDTINRHDAGEIRDPGQLIEYISVKAQDNIGIREPSHFHDYPTPIIPIPCQSAVRSMIRAMKRDFETSLASRFMLS